jgi:hypothetical protein
MLVRLQLSDRALAAMLRGRFQRQGLCVTDPISGGANPTYIDHIEISGIASLFSPTIFEDGDPQIIKIAVVGGTASTVTAPILVLNRQVTLYTTTMDDLNAAGGGPPSVSEPIPLPLKFSLKVEHVDFMSQQPLTDLPGQEVVFDQLTVAYYGLGDVPDQLLSQAGTTRAALDGQLKALLPPVSTPIDLTSALTQLGTAGFSPASVWSGIASNAEYDRVEIRLELATSGVKGVADAAAWTQFYNHQGVDDLIASQDWALFLDKDLLVGMVAATMTPPIKNASGFRLDSGPSFSWDGGVPGVVASFNGDVINACQCFWGDIDVNADVAVTVSFGANHGLLQIDVRLSHSANQWQLICCELTAALFWPVLGLLESSSGWVYLGGLALGPLAVFIGAIVKASNTTMSVSPPAEFTADPNDPEHFFSLISVTSALNASPDGFFSFEEVQGTGAGLVMRGAYTDRELKPATITAEVQQFGWVAPEYSCSAITGQWKAHAEIAVSKATGDLDFWFCNASVDPPEFRPYLSTTYSYFPYTATVRLDVSTQVPGSPTVFIQTTGGLRLITLDPMPTLDEQDVEEFNQSVLRWRMETCFTLVDPWFRYFDRFNPKWSIDPPYEGDWHQLWIQALAGLRPGDRVIVGDADGEPIVTGIASAAGALEMSAIVNSPQLTLVREPATGSEPEEPDPNRPASSLKQVLLEKVASFTARQPVLAMQGIPSHSGFQLLVATVEGLEIVTVDQHGTLFLSRRRTGEPLAGAAAMSGRLVGWTAAGTIVDVTAVSGALQPSELDANVFRRLKAILARGVTHIATDADQLLAVSGGIIRKEDGQPAITTASLASAVTASGSGILVTTGNGQYRLHKRRPRGSHEFTSEYLNRPWFAGSANLGPWLTILDRDGATIQLLRIAGQRTI